jgi:hypothetical protein
MQTVLDAQVGPRLHWFAGFASILCTYRSGKPERALAIAAELSKRIPEESSQTALFFAASDGGAFDDAERALSRAISIDPSMVRALEPGQVGPAIRSARMAKRRDVADAIILKLADIGYGGDELDVRDSYLASAVELHLTAGRQTDAERLARLIVSRDPLVDLLTYRTAEPLWPVLEKSVGAGMERTNLAALSAARNRVAGLGAPEGSTESARAFLSLMRALWHAGLRSEALATGTGALTTAEAVAAAGEEQGWLLNEHAFLLAESGSVDAADRRLRSLTDLSIKERPWLVSMRINHALMLLAHGRPNEVIPLLPALQRDAQTYGNGYARQLVRWAATCAMARADRMPDAQALRADLLAHTADARAATARALLCIGDEEAASAIVVAALGDVEHRDSLIDSLQPEWVRPDVRSGMLRPLLLRSDVEAAYKRVARDLPEGLRQAN